MTARRVGEEVDDRPQEAVERVSNDRLTFLMQHGAGKSSDVPPLCLDLRDCRARLAEAERERDEARASYEQEVEQFNAGHEVAAKWIGKMPASPRDADSWQDLPVGVPDHDTFAMGFAWGGWERLAAERDAALADSAAAEAQVAALREAALLLLKQSTTWNTAIEAKMIAALDATAAAAQAHDERVRREMKERCLGLAATIRVALNGEQIQERRDLIAAIRTLGETE